MATNDRSLRIRNTAAMTQSSADSSEADGQSSRKKRRKEWWSQKISKKEEEKKRPAGRRSAAAPPEERPRIPRLVIQNKGGFKSRLIDTVKIKLPTNSDKPTVKQSVAKPKKKTVPKAAKTVAVVPVVESMDGVAVTTAAVSSINPPPMNNCHMLKQYVLFVGNLPYDVTKEQLEEHFRKTGGVKNIRIPKEKGTDKGKGFAFIELKDRISYGIALRLHHTTMSGRKINVEFTSVGGNNEKRKNKLKKKNKSLAKKKLKSH